VKEQLRKRLMEKRKSLTKGFVFEKSELIKQKLFNLDEFKMASTILFYVSYDNEVFTHNMIRDSISFGKKVVVPISIIEERSLLLSRLEKFEDLVVGSYDILEPRPDKIKVIPINKIDLMFVPGVGFDSNGHRIGHGKGYYDNLLKISKSHMHIGLAFEFQIVDRIPIESHDLPVEKIITEKRIINCLK
jgi:5-formyltetrahydrofolate cyclo-ligase